MNIDHSKHLSHGQREARASQGFSEAQDDGQIYAQVHHLNAAQNSSDARHADPGYSKKKAMNAHFQTLARDKKGDMQIVTASDPRASHDLHKPQTAHSTRNSFTVEPKKISLKHPETTKNIQNHQSFKTSEFQNEQSNSFHNHPMPGAAFNYGTADAGSQRNQSAPRAGSHQHPASQAQSLPQKREQYQDSTRRHSQNIQSSQQHSGMRQPQQPHQQQIAGPSKRNDSGRRGVQQKSQIVPGAVSNQQYQYQLQLQLQQQQQIEQQIRQSQKQELARLEQQQLQEQLVHQQKQALLMQQQARGKEAQGLSEGSGGGKEAAPKLQARSKQAVQQSHGGHQQQYAPQSRGNAGMQGNKAESKGDGKGQQNTRISGTGEAEMKSQEANGGGAAASAFGSIVCQVPQGGHPQAQNQTAATSKQAKNPKPAGNVHSAEQDWLIGPQRKGDFGRKTLVLDLDETLVHSQFKPVENADIILPVEIEGQICQIYILVRPGVSRFLKRMSRHYEMVVFTASLSKYAEPLVAQLDPEGYCAYKLFREHCTFYNNAFVKDLTRLGRPMTDVIIVDNSPIAFMFQPENAIPCTSWYDDMSDTELDRIATLLERLAYEEDVRKVVRKVIKNNAIDDRSEQIYLQSQKRDHSQKQVDSRRNPQAASNGRPDNERGLKSGHQRYESADNRHKHQAIIQDKIRRQQLDQQFTMTDNNLEQMLKQIQVKKDNYVDSQGQLAQGTAPAAEGSSKKKRRSQDQAANSKSQKEAVADEHHRVNQSQAVHHRQERLENGRPEVEQSKQRAGSREPQKQSKERERSVAGKKPQSQGSQQYSSNSFVQMVYHPMTTKGNQGHTQQFNFEPNDMNSKQLVMSAAPNTSPSNKRSTSVKHANQPQILKEGQVMLVQQTKQAANNQRQRGFSAHQQSPQVSMVSASVKGKQAMLQSGSATLGTSGQGGQASLNSGPARSGSGQRKKVHSYSNFMGNSQKSHGQAPKAQAAHRQSSTQAYNQLNNSQRASSGSHKATHPGQQYVNLSQSQRVNMHNYNQSLKAGAPSQNAANQDAYSKAQRQSHNAQNTSHILKQSIKDFQDMIKMTNDQRQMPPSLNQAHMTQHGPALTIQPQAVSSTKSKKVQSPGGQFQNQYNTTSYSQRDDMGFLNKLSNQQREAQMQYGKQGGHELGPPPGMGRGGHQAQLGPGMQSHAPYPAVISLNSPKYAQGGNLLGQAMGSNPQAYAQAMHAPDNSNPQFNRTGPIILSNTRPAIADPSLAMYQQPVSAGPVSTKNSHAADRRGDPHARYSSKDANRAKGTSGGRTGSQRNPSSHHGPSSHPHDKGNLSLVVGGPKDSSGHGQLLLKESQVKQPRKHSTHSDHHRASSQNKRK